jgi:hypothetical protein
MAQVLSRLAAALLVLVFTWQGAVAMPIEGRVRGIEKLLSLNTVNGVSFKYDLDFRLGMLMGDPVIQLRFRWLADRSLTKVKVPVRREGKWVDVEMSLYDLGPEAQRMFDIYDVKVQVRFQSGGKNYYLVEDAGAIARGDGKKWSYNTPGSPQWDKFLTDQRSTAALPARFVSAAEAKQAVKAGLVLKSFQILGLKRNDAGIRSWYSGSAQNKIAAREQALRRIATGVKRSFGYEAFPDLIINEARSRFVSFNRQKSGDMVRAYEAQLAVLDRAIEKLKNLPERFKDKGSPESYEAAVSGAEDELADHRQQLASKQSETAAEAPRSLRKAPGSGGGQQRPAATAQLQLPSAGGASSGVGESSSQQTQRVQQPPPRAERKRSGIVYYYARGEGGVRSKTEPGARTGYSWVSFAEYARAWSLQRKRRGEGGCVYRAFRSPVVIRAELGAHEKDPQGKLQRMLKRHNRDRDPFASTSLDEAVKWVMQQHSKRGPDWELVENPLGSGQQLPKTCKGS